MDLSADDFAFLLGNCVFNPARKNVLPGTFAIVVEFEAQGTPVRRFDVQLLCWPHSFPRALSSLRRASKSRLNELAGLLVDDPDAALAVTLGATTYTGAGRRLSNDPFNPQALPVSGPSLCGSTAGPLAHLHAVGCGQRAAGMLQ